MANTQKKTESTGFIFPSHPQDSLYFLEDSVFNRHIECPAKVEITCINEIPPLQKEEPKSRNKSLLKWQHFGFLCAFV